MSGNFSRKKGGRLEREVVNLLKKAGFEAKRTGFHEAGGVDKGDVEVEGFIAEVKGNGAVPKFIYTARKEQEHLLFMKRSRKEWVVAMSIGQFVDLLKSYVDLQRKVPS